MGTRNSRLRRRATKRGLASFVSFLLLFAFALGQSSLSALADDAGTDPVAAEDLVSDGSRLGETLPVAEEETAAEEESPVADAGDGGAAASTDDGSSSTSGAAGARRGQVNTTRANRNTALAAPAAPLAAADLVGGDVSLDFVAAGPFTYDHSTGLGSPPQFGYDNRNISKTNGVVESLEGGDFACDDLVTFFVQVVIDNGADSGAVELDLSFGNETTGQPGIGFDDIVSVAVNLPDGGNVGLDGNETATLSNEHLDTAGYDTIDGTVTVTGLDAGEHLIARVIVHLACEVGGTPTGNILNAITAARVVGGGTINVGQETVPMKQVGGIAAEPIISVTKDCPAEVPFGEEISYTITVSNDGNEVLTGLTVTDTLLGDITGEFTDTTLDVGEIDTATVGYTPQAGDPDPLTNTVTAEADGGISGTHVSQVADCTTDITHEPGIDVTKSCPASVPFGEDIEYTITVENTGNEPLVGVTVDDTLLGDITGDFDFDFANPFPVGEVATAVVSYTPQAGDPDPLTNTVTATGTGADSDAEASDDASCTTDIKHEPGIDVTKSCPESVPFGEDIEYTITVENTGNEPLVGVTVDDTLLGDITGDFDFDFANPFPVGEVATAVVSYTPQAGDPDPLTNTVTATGTGADSDAEASDDASCTTDIKHEPGIDVTKSCPASVPFGEDIEYTITVENTGNEPLVGVTVDDTLLGDITGDFDFDFANPFPVGEVATAVVSYTPQAGDPDPLTNTVTATGTGADSDAEASDDASCTTDILNPTIDVEKSCTELAHVGDTVTYTITVTNTGDEDLDGVTVMDTILGDLSASFADELAVGASESHDFDYVVQADDDDPLVNEVTAAGSGVGSRVVVDDLANCATDIIHPGIEIVKTVDEETVPIGTTVTYTYVITNTGDTTLYDISVDDDILGHIGDIEVLEPGQSVTLTKDFVVGDEPVTNVGTAEGEDILGRSVSSLDDATVTPIADVPPVPPTPFTGSDAGRLGIISMVLFGIGVTVVATTRRRRPEREAA